MCLGYGQLYWIIQSLVQCESHVDKFNCLHRVSWWLRHWYLSHFDAGQFWLFDGDFVTLDGIYVNMYRKNLKKFLKFDFDLRIDYYYSNCQKHNIF